MATIPKLLTASPPQAAGYPTLQPAAFLLTGNHARSPQVGSYAAASFATYGHKIRRPSPGAARLRQTRLTALPAHPALAAAMRRGHQAVALDL